MGITCKEIPCPCVINLGCGVWLKSSPTIKKNMEPSFCKKEFL